MIGNIRDSNYGAMKITIALKSQPMIKQRNSVFANRLFATPNKQIHPRKQHQP